MIDDVDRSLQAALESLIRVETCVSFSPPTSSRPEAAEPPGLNVFLFRVTHNTSALNAGLVDVRDRHGRVIGRARPPQCFRLHYMLSVAAHTTAEEHRILGQIISKLADLQVIPALGEGAAFAGASLSLRLADEDAAPVPVEMWRALGVKPRSNVELVVTCAVQSPAVTTPPVVGKVVLNTDATVGSPVRHEPGQ